MSSALPPRDPQTGQFVSASASPTANSAGGSDEIPTANARADDSTGLRMALAAMLGASQFAERDIYDTFDWPERPDEKLFYATYRPNPFAAPIVDRPAFTTWRDGPTIRDRDPRTDNENGNETETAFETAVTRANRELDLWSYGERLDRLAGIGRYGLLVFVTDDISSPDDLDSELGKGAVSNGLDSVTQIKVFSEVSVDNIEWGGIDAAEAGRWGLPIRYSIDFSSEATNDDGADSDEAVYSVHHSRTIAVPATRLLDDDFFAPSRLEGCLNPLRDIEKVLGSVAELAFRGADKGLAVNFGPEKVDTSVQSFDAMDEELQDWYHGLQPWVKMVGADSIQTLGGEIADPSAVIDKNLSAIAANTGIPKRIFEGDPAGALAAAAEDTQAYFGMIQERREEYATPHIVKALVDWLTDHGVIDGPGSQGQYDVEWEALRVLSEKEQAELENNRATAWAEFTGGLPFELGYQIALDYLREGELPEAVDELAVDRTRVDESDPQVQEQFDQAFGSDAAADATAGSQEALADGGESESEGEGADDDG